MNTHEREAVRDGEKELATKGIRMVYARDGKHVKAGDCTRCRINLLDVPKGFYCGVCKWEAK